MVVISLKKDGDSLERAEQAIAHGEAFVVVVEGLKARIAQKMKPAFEYLAGQKRRKLGLLERLKFMAHVFYAPFVGDLGAILYYARKAGMSATWEERQNSLIVTFRFPTLEEDHGEEGSSWSSTGQFGK